MLLIWEGKGAHKAKMGVQVRAPVRISLGYQIAAPARYGAEMSSNSAGRSSDDLDVQSLHSQRPRGEGAHVDCRSTRKATARLPSKRRGANDVQPAACRALLQLDSPMVSDSRALRSLCHACC